MHARAFTRTALSLAVVGACASTVHAAGFQLLEQNASGLGNAYAGSAAIAENASTVHYNPAGMSFLPGVNVSAGFSLIRPSFKFTDNGNSRDPAAMGGRPPTGGNGGDAGGKFVPVPNGAATWQLNDRWHLGIHAGGPFGLATTYNNDWAGQYHSKHFAIKTYNVNPSVSYRVNDMLALGFGVNYQWIDAEYTKTAVVAQNVARGAKVKIDGGAWGWNVGGMLQATPDTRIGVSYRSRVRHKASGSTTIDDRGRFDAKANVALPDTAILSVMHNLNARWTLLGDVSWTGWSSIPELNIRNTTVPGDTLKLEFRDTWRVALGATYKATERWRIKGGVAFDQSPVHEARYRPTSLPDNNRWWLSAGVQYQFSPATTIDVGYSYLLLRKTKIDNNGEDLLKKGRVAGDYKGNGNIIGVQLTSRF
jgi:long-chain fatty acid transport protein